MTFFPNLKKKNPTSKKIIFFVEDWDFDSVNVHTQISKQETAESTFMSPALILAGE